MRASPESLRQNLQASRLRSYEKTPGQLDWSGVWNFSRRQLLTQQSKRGFDHLRTGHAVLFVEMFREISALAEFVVDAK